MMRFTKYVIAFTLTTSLFSQVPIQTFVLPSGLVCKLIENHNKPLIHVQIVNRWNIDGLVPKKAGLSELLATTIGAIATNKYTNGKHNDQYNELAFRAVTGSYYWSITTDSYSQEAALELLANTIIHPNINSTIVEKQRQALLKQYAYLSPHSLALNRFLRSVGDSTVLTPIEVTALGNVSYQDLLSFKQLIIRPEASLIAFYGDLNIAQAKQLVMLHFGTWDSSKKLISQQLCLSDNYSNGPEITTTPKSESEAKLWIGVSCPNGNINQATSLLLPIVLNRITKSLSRELQIDFSLSTNLQHLLIKTQIPKADATRLFITVISTLDKLQKSRISSEDLRRALVQWNAENDALLLHPTNLLRKVVNGMLEPELLQAVKQVTADNLNQAIKLWLKPERARILLLGADTPEQQDMEKVGLYAWINRGSTS